MNQDMSILSLVLHASLVVQIVMAGLLITSLASWSVIFSKLFGLRRVRGQNETFERELPLHDAVLFSDYGKGGLTHITRMIESARAAGKPVLVDPKGTDYARYAGASVITPNRAELAQIVGAWSSEAQLGERAQALRAELRVDALLLTRSEDGMTLFDERGAAHQPAQTREVFDVTGAGDTVIATMAVLLAAGLEARDAMPHANRAGGIVVGKFGTASASYAELFG